jgi:hypothetical protein
MTKKQMIQTIQAVEAAAFLECKKSQRAYGKESPLHQSARSRWCAIDGLLRQLGVEADFTLPDSREAFAIVCELA